MGKCSHSHAVAVAAPVADDDLGGRVARAVGRRHRCRRRGGDGVGVGAHVGGRGALGAAPLLVAVVPVVVGAVLVVVVVAAVPLLGLLGILIVGEGLEILLQGLKRSTYTLIVCPRFYVQQSAMVINAHPITASIS